MLPAAAALALAGCGDAATATPPAVEYHRDIAPLLRERCVTCHQAGGLAPMALTTYAEVRQAADAIAHSTRSREMPPIPAAADGSCQTFSDATWLTEEQIGRLETWARQGAPEGAPPSTPEPLPAPGGLTGNVLEATMEAPYTPLATPDGPDRYRCFKVDPHLARSGYVTAAEFLPGSKEQVHHVLLFAIDPSRSLGSFTNAEGIAQMEADDPESGWSCYGGLGPALVPRSQLPSWFSGDPVTAMPDGMGMPLNAGEWLVLQMHYRAREGEPEPDQTTIRLRMADTVQTPVVTVFRDPISFATGTPPSLPPHRPDARFQWELPASDLQAEVEAQGLDTSRGFRLIGVAPHMHELATRYDLSITRGTDAPLCGLEVPRWDFHWQRSYFYSTPIDLADLASARLGVTCTYDTQSQSSPTYAGHNKGQEMCGLLAFLAAR